MEFQPYGRVYYYENDLQKKEINCTVNKPANISIFFRHIWKPVTEEPRELKTTRSVFGIALQRLNAGCTYAIKFHNTSSLMSICYIGEYTCRAVADNNETTTMNQKFVGGYRSTGN